MFGVSRRIQPAPFIDACKSLASVRNDNDPEAATREEWRKSCAPLDIRNVWQIRTERKEERIFCHVIRTSEVSMHCFESRCCGIVAIPHLVARRFGMSCCQHAPQSDQQRRRVQFLPRTQKYHHLVYCCCRTCHPAGLDDPKGSPTFPRRCSFQDVVPDFRQQVLLESRQCTNE